MRREWIRNECREEEKVEICGEEEEEGPVFYYVLPPHPHLLKTLILIKILVPRSLTDLAHRIRKYDSTARLP